MAALGSINFGGLASGLDTNKIIEDLMQVDSRPLKRLENQQTDMKEKLDTFSSMKSNLLELKNKAFNLKTASSFGVFSASSSDEEALTVSASTSANEGNYSIKILSLAQAKALAGNSYEATDTSIGLSGEILINNHSLTIEPADRLIDIRNGINALDAGVTASILKVTDSDNRLIISSQIQGSEGFLIANAGSSDILGSLGITDGTKNVRKVVNGQLLSADFASSQSTIGSLLDISAMSSGTVKIRNYSLFIDLANDTLSTLRDKINDLGIDVFASVESETVDSETVYRLAITGTEDFEDDGNVLETLGILEGGTSGTYAAFRTNSVFNNNNYYGDSEDTANNLNDSSSSIEKSKITNYGANINETITVYGTNVDGSSVSTNIEIGAETKVEDILSGIEEAFSGNVTAVVQDSQISIRSNIAGKNYLDVGIRANNELGGILDFGIITTETVGRDRLIVEGNDARILVNNIEVERDSNEVNDVLPGLSFTLKKADPDTDINITVERNTDSIRTKIEEFVTSHNTLIDFINENSKYDEEEKISGPLLGDQTSRSVENRIRDALQGRISDSDFAYQQLVQIGIETTTEGKLEIDTARLNEVMDEDMESVISLFTATRTASDNDITFVYHSNKTKPGTYNVEIAQAAEKATVSSKIIDDIIEESGTVAITDNYGNSMNVEYEEGFTLSDLANALNEEAQKTYNRILQSIVALTISNENGSISQRTEIKDINGVDVKENDTITINITNSSGKSYHRIITMSDDENTTIGDVLNAIESMNDYEVNATIDSEGNIRIEDNTTGKSSIALSISTTVQGLDFGDFETLQEGRNTINIEAEVTDDNRLMISHNAYGSNKSFAISGASGLGIEDDEYTGVDVAGTINGDEGTGNGQILSATDENESTRGIVINVDLTPEELEGEGQEQGAITLITGIADNLYSELTSLTNIVNGFVQVKIDNLEVSLDSIQSRIDSVNRRLEARRLQYVRKFTELEKAIARLQSLQDRLSSSLQTLPSSSIFSSAM